MNGIPSSGNLTGILPLAVVLVPIGGAFLSALIGRLSERYRDFFVLAVTALTFVLSAILFRISWSDLVVSHFTVGFNDVSLYFRVDKLGAVFNLLSAFVWFLATLFSISYMTHESRRNRYYTFYLLTLGGCLGVFLTADLFSLFFFFEMMSVASYLLVVHNQSEEALKAGRLYIFLGIFGGLCLLSATMLIYWYTGSVFITPMLEQLIVLPARFLILILMIIGFGIKAGMVPLHIWLPKAHPVAPAPASALLSGIMIKTGAYGIIRVMTVIYTPVVAEAKALWAFSEHTGYGLILIGILTMFIAAVMALFQLNAKRILAYSSISQMGYILMGVGVCAYLGLDGAVAFGGFTFHMVNHAFFKAAMFMMVGAVFYRTGEIELQRLGGLWREFPVTTVVFLLAAMGIAGIPGLNGYTSKVLLHHAIVEAYEHHHLVSLYWAERIFMLTGVLTTCYITRLFSSIFLGSKPAHLKVIKKEPWNERTVFVTIGLILLFIGTNPFIALEKLITPLAKSFRFDAYSIKHLLEVNFWDIHDLQSMVWVVGIAALLFGIGTLTGFFNIKLPRWLSIEQIVYRPVVSLLLFIFTRSGRALELTVDRAYINSPRMLTYYCIGGKMLDAAADYLLVDTLEPLKKLSSRIYGFEKQGEWFTRFMRQIGWIMLNIHKGWVYYLRTFFNRSRIFFLTIFYFLFHLDYKPRGKFFMLVNTSNFEYYVIIFFLVLIIIMSLQLFT
jgi:hydrogenase-4 component B